MAEAAVVSILLYGCTIWTLIKRLEKKIDGNYTRMLPAILNKSWRQHPTRHQLYGHLPPITKTIQVRRARHAGHCWRRRDELIRDVLLWTPHMDELKQDDQLEHTYSSYVRIWDVALKTCCYILTFGPSKHAITKWCTGRKWHIPMASNRKKSRRRKFANKMGQAKKNHDTLIDWHTGREWPLNCMAVISAWWRLNMRFQRSSGRSSGRGTII